MITKFLHNCTYAVALFSLTAAASAALNEVHNIHVAEQTTNNATPELRPKPVDQSEFSAFEDDETQDVTAKSARPEQGKRGSTNPQSQKHDWIPHSWSEIY